MNNPFSYNPPSDAEVDALVLLRVVDHLPLFAMVSFLLWAIRCIRGDSERTNSSR